MTIGNELYVDPAVAPGGDGQIGTPFGSIQEGLDSSTAATAGPTRFNVKAGTADTISADLDFSTWLPSAANPVIIQGYKTAAGDGNFQGYLADQGRVSENYGIAEIVLGTFEIGDGGTNSSFVSLKHLEIHGKTTNGVAVNLDNNNSIVECDIHDCASNWVHTDNYSWIIGCYVHDVSGSGELGQHASVCYCYFESGTKNFNQALGASGSLFAYSNIFDIASSSTGINASYTLAPQNLFNNTFLSDGTGSAIEITNAGSTALAHNNYIEGFATGIGGLPSGQGEPHWIYNNRFFNCTTDIDTNLTSSSLMPADMVGENVALTATGLSKSGTKSVENRFTYFAPVDTDTDMFGASYPKSDTTPTFADGYSTIGALQLASAAVPNTPTGVFNVSKGRGIELGGSVGNGGPANAAIVMVLCTGTETDAVLEDFDTLADILAGNLSEATFTNYARKIITNPTTTTDDANNLASLDVPDQTWTSAGGATNNTLTRVLVCYDHDTTSGTDSDIQPLCYYDISYTTDGSDLTISPDAAGLLVAN